MIDGQAAQEFEPGGKAACEVAQACEWVSALLNSRTSKRSEKGAAA
jgi:hypothetical protein